MSAHDNLSTDPTYEHYRLDWPTAEKATNETYKLTVPTIFEYTVPADEVPRYGAFQVTPTPDSGNAPQYVSILAETLGGPPMEGTGTRMEGTSPRTPFTVGKAAYGAVLMPGSPYFQCVTPMTFGDWRTNIQLLAMGKL